MSNLDPVAYADEYVGLLRNPASAEDALLRLIEGGSKLVPVLCNLLKTERDSAVKTKIIHVLWQGRDPRVIPMLAEALRDSEGSVWREALDGLASFPSEVARQPLEAALVEFTNSNDTTKIAWVKEALADSCG